MRRARHSRVRDHALLGAMGLLLLLGIIVIYTISPVLNYGQFDGEVGANYFLYKHLLNVVVGLGAFFVASRISLERWRQFMPVILGLTALTTILLFIPATRLTLNGATRWISIAGFSFQPAELLKFALVLYFAFFLGSRDNREIENYQQTLIPVAWLLAALGLLLVIIEKDLGTMVVVTGIIVGMLYFRGAPKQHLAALVGSLSALGVLSILMFPHRLSRLTTFLNPGGDLQGAGYHIDQALTAIGSGGIFGLGLGRSVQVYGFLPEAENDSVFAIHGEIFGFVGTVAVIIIFGLLLWRILNVAQSQTDQTARLLVSGVFVWILAHVVINIGAMLSLMPLTGITLPFLSYGGSSLMMMLAGLGIVYRFSHEQRTVSQPSSHSRYPRTLRKASR